MKIYGLQKMTLLDYPGRVACTVFLGGCSFRCPYCHNYELVDGSAAPLMEEKELFAFLGKRKGLLDGVAVTGGEPCLSPELPAFLGALKEMGYAVKLDTNGSFPEVLKEVTQSGLVDYVAMDIKNSPEKYALTAGRDHLDLGPVKESVRLLMEGCVEYEFRTTIVDELHEAEDFEQIGAWIRGSFRYFLQPFTDRDSVPYGSFHAPDDKQLREYLKIMKSYVPNSELRGIESPGG